MQRPDTLAAGAERQAEQLNSMDDEKKFGDDEQEENDNAAIVKPEMPWKYKGVAFACVLLWGSGAWFADSTFGPLKSTIVRELKVNSEYNSPWPST